MIQLIMAKVYTMITKIHTFRILKKKYHVNNEHSANIKRSVRDCILDAFYGCFVYYIPKKIYDY